MGHYAKVRNNIVEEVLVATKDFVDSLEPEEGVSWIKTSYNTYGGVHYDPETKEPDDLPPLRKNFASLGFTYDESRDAFIPPRPYDSWVLDEDECLWYPPNGYPEDDSIVYVWDEDKVEWVPRDPDA